jgi:hypothetical protein
MTAILKFTAVLAVVLIVCSVDSIVDIAFKFFGM